MDSGLDQASLSSDVFGTKPLFHQVLRVKTTLGRYGQVCATCGNEEGLASLNSNYIQPRAVNAVAMFGPFRQHDFQRASIAVGGNESWAAGHIPNITSHAQASRDKLSCNRIHRSKYQHKWPLTKKGAVTLCKSIAFRSREP